jgi:RNA polymerase sigma-70 factor, ECF subfamily
VRPTLETRRMPVPARKPETPDAAETGHAELAARAARGDRDAFGELVRIHAPMVHGILLARVPVSEVRDLVQDVFTLALERLGTLRETQAFGGWLAMIARNRTVDFHRRSSHRKTAPLEVDVAVSDPDRAEVEERWRRSAGCPTPMPRP